MRHEPEFTWDEETKVATCTIKDNKNRTFIGEAHCHEDDFDMGTALVGYEIAYRRAIIEQLCYIRDAEIKPGIAALKQLYYSMNRSANFNENSYENSMLQRQLCLLEFDLATVKEIIADKRKSLKDYTEKKDKFYKSVRKRREGQN